MSIETAPPGVPQQVAVGATLSSRYGRLKGFTGGRMTAPLKHLSGAFLGQPDSGKSNLIQSCPTGYIFNFDLTTAPGGLLAETWPGVSPEGRALGDDGRPTILDWGVNILPRIDLLVDLAHQNQPRPTTVFFDTLGSAVRFCKSWSSSNLFANQDPRAMWDRVHESIIGVTTRLRNAGYGVFWNVHVVNARVPLGEDRFVFAPELASPITAGFWSKIYPVFEFVASIQAPFEPVTRTVTKTVLVRGQNMVTNEPVTTNEKVYFATTSDETFAGLTKARVSKPLPPRILLPKAGAWEALEAVYAEHTRG